MGAGVIVWPTGMEGGVRDVVPSAELNKLAPPREVERGGIFSWPSSGEEE